MKRGRLKGGKSDGLFSQSRRDFMSGLTNQAGALTMTGLLGLGGLVAYQARDEGCVDSKGCPPDVPGNWVELLQNLNGDIWANMNTETVLMVGDAHDHYFRYQDSPSFNSAVGPFHAAYNGFFRREIAAKYINLDKVNGDIVTFGSPSSNELMQVLMGYENSSGSSLDLEFVGTERKFPFHLDLTANHPSVVRLSRGKEYLEPAWSITGPDNTLYAPKTGDNSKIISDFLLITRMPNPVVGGRHILNFAGLHGAGTAAVQLLIDNPQEFLSLESKISEATKGGRYPEWQALIPVTEVVEHYGNNRPETLDMQSAQVFPIVLA